MNTIAYYNANAQSFYERTINTDLSHFHTKFLDFLPEKAHILDAGCGSGRDTKYFQSQEHTVTAFDASEEMVRISTKETNQQTKLLKFQSLNFKEEFDGVWANASLLHIPYEEIQDVYGRIYNALKPGGIFYGSYKYGEGHMSVKGREFYNMNEETVLPYLEDLFEVIEICQTEDTRSQVAPSPDNAWLNFIVRK
jgi:SAM-dependent methyltransferase